MTPFDPRVYIKMMFYSIVFILVCTYLFADTRTIKGDKFEQDGQWCFVQVVYNTKDDDMKTMWYNKMMKLAKKYDMTDYVMRKLVH